MLHVIPSARPRGAQREARALADRLDAPGVRRHRVLTLFDETERRDQGADVVVDYALHHPGGSSPGVRFDPRVLRGLRVLLDDLAPTVVVAHGGEPLKFLVPAMFRRRRPLAYYAIGTLARPAHRPVRRVLWRFLVRRADVVLTEGAEVLEECRTVLGVLPARLVLTPNGRDPEEFRPAPGGTPPRPVPVVSFVGALTTQKRPDRFVAVVAALRDRGIDVRAQVVGDGPLRSVLVGSAAAAEVELLGARHDVADLMRGTDVLVFPSLPHGEGMPGVLIEAGLSGVPVVATDVPGVANIVSNGETGTVVDADDFDALVMATAALVADPLLRQRLGRAARDRCRERFALDVVASQWLDALTPLLKGA